MRAAYPPPVLTATRSRPKNIATHRLYQWDGSGPSGALKYETGGLGRAGMRSSRLPSRLASRRER